MYVLKLEGCGDGVYKLDVEKEGLYTVRLGLIGRTVMEFECDCLYDGA